MPDDVRMGLGSDGNVDSGVDSGVADGVDGRAHGAFGAAAGPTEVEDRGSFSHGVCRVCGWLGPGRRARRTSHRDAADHAGSCPGAPQRTDP